MKSFMASPSTVERKWYVVDAMKETTLKEMMNKKAEFVITHAVKGMLPKGPLGRQMLTKLHVYAGPEHKHAAQKPEALDI